MKKKDNSKQRIILFLSLAFIFLFILFNFLEMIYFKIISFLVFYFLVLQYFLIQDKNSLKNSWKFIKQSQKYIYSIIGIFFFFALIGFFIPVPEILREQIIQMIQELLEQTKGMNTFEMIDFIFFNNTSVSFFAMIAGLIFGIMPIFSSVFNGYLVGFVSNLSVQAGGFFSLWRLLPHGIFELPAVFIALGLGLRLGLEWIVNKKGTHKEILINSVKAFFFIIVPLLIVAGIIEGILIGFVN